MSKIVAVMACPTGIAHTVMAAEALEKTAQAMGHTLRAEMQGSIGTKNVLTEQEIIDSDVVIIATDIHVSMDRFGGKTVYATSTSDAIRKTRSVIEAALAEAAEAQEVVPTPVAAAHTLSIGGRQTPGGGHILSYRYRSHLYGC